MAKFPNIYALDTARWARLALFVAGIVLITGGIIAFLTDLTDGYMNRHAPEYLAIIGAGAVVLMVTTIIYQLLPAYYRQKRIDVLRSYYPDTRSGIMMGLQHDIKEELQGIMFNSEIMNERLSYAVKGAHGSERIEQIKTMYECLGHIKEEIQRLERHIRELRHNFEAEVQEKERKS